MALFAMVKGHVAVVQMYAWSEMIADRTQERGLVEALESVASGDEPCALCCAIVAELAPAEPTAPAPETVKEPLLPKFVPLGIANPELPRIAQSGRLAISRTQASYRGWQGEIPTPPPRA